MIFNHGWTRMNTDKDKQLIRELREGARIFSKMGPVAPVSASLR